MTYEEELLEILEEYAIRVRNSIKNGAYREKPEQAIKEIKQANKRHNHN